MLSRVGLHVSRRMARPARAQGPASLAVRTAKSAPSIVVPAAAGRAGALSAAIKQIESSFGKGAIMKLGDREAPINVEAVSTGSLSLDLALGIGGLPFGRVVEIYGPESSGKTTLALHVVAEAQKAGKTCCFIDAEHALDPAYARRVGVNLDALFLSQPDSGEQALEIADTLVRSGGMDVLIIDSVAALVPRVEIEGEMGDQHMALQARLMSQALRKLTANLSKSKALIIFINQIRQKVGVIFGSPDVTPGGNALKFYSSIRMEIRRTGQIKKGEEVVGNTTRVKIAKNKLAPPFRTADFDMTYGYGISRSSEVVELGPSFGVLRKSGAWYAVSSPELLEAIKEEARLIAAGGDATAAAPAPAAAAAPPAAPAAAAPAPAAAKGKGGKKGSKAAAAPAADAAADAAAAAAPAPPPPAPAAAGAGTGGGGAVLDFNVPDLNDPFMNGKEKMKAFLDAHPRVLAAAIRIIHKAIKASGGAPGALPTVGDASRAAANASAIAAAAAEGMGGAAAAGGMDEEEGEEAYVEEAEGTGAAPLAPGVPPISSPAGPLY